MAINVDAMPLNQIAGLNRLHLVIEGRCQGVGFRYTAASIAEQLGLTGWVKNHMDGSVEMEIQGSSLGIRRFLKKLNASYARFHFDFWARSATSVSPIQGEKRFAVRY